MKKPKRTTAAWIGGAVCVAAACAVLLLGDRGAKAVPASAYADVAAPLEAGAELKALPDATDGVPGMILAAESDRLSLYYDMETTEIAVKDKRQGDVWYSNPPERESDAKASGFEKELLSSQLSVSFRDSVGTLETYTNFAQSISSKQFKAEAIPGGLRVVYTIGDTSLGVDALPRLITKARLEEKVLSKLDSSSAKYVEKRYYPTEADPELLERLDAQVSKPLVLSKMTEAFEKAGYTPDDLAADNAAAGIEGGAASTKPNFTVPLEYRLDGGSLRATVPMGRVEEGAGYQIRSLDVLPFFGAAGSGEQGYMLVPDGSGSLIHLNNGKVKEEQYVQRIYGMDPNDNSWRRGQVSQSARMPVFGLKAGNAAWLATIEQGDALASVAADISGKKNSYNFVHSRFHVRGEDVLELYTGNKVQEIQLLNDRLHRGDLTVRYSFLDHDAASYSGMAAEYRSQLQASGVLQPLQEQGSLPFYLDILGAVDKRKSFLGVPYRSLVTMTTFEQAGSIAEQLKQLGASRVLMRYEGWSSGGAEHGSPDSLRAAGGLGGERGLKALRQQLESQGGLLFPDTAFQRIYRDDGGFKPSADAARFVTREQAELYPYNRALSRMDMTLGSFYLLSPTKLPSYVDAFLAGFKRQDAASGVALRDLGDVLASDYREGRVVQREAAKTIVERELGKISGSVGRTLLVGGNAYAWKDADHLVDVPTGSSGFVLTDEEVPFYQMVVHGSIPYAGQAWNLADEQDMRKQLLRSLELGAAPRFYLSHEPSSKLKFTSFDARFSSESGLWLKEAAALYLEADKALAPVQNDVIAEHVRHPGGVVEVRYAKGTTFLINYSDQPQTVNGRTLAPESYWIGGKAS
ncbi:DUF5696 domain-containing protein [Paenibacillus pasadenensis]|uniref:DUF5696 domain-containing protein n=1 Tax=Paenibacillus pasadenensis TaxID=217090 RepID=UPI00040685E1|nr:DUF5696 domain-containing protein [Paenibacillus pasadenensis]